MTQFSELHTIDPEHIHKYQIDKFIRLRNGENDYLISNNIKNKKKYFHKITDPNLTEPKSEG